MGGQRLFRFEEGGRLAETHQFNRGIPIAGDLEQFIELTGRVVKAILQEKYAALRDGRADLLDVAERAQNGLHQRDDFGLPGRANDLNDAVIGRHPDIGAAGAGIGRQSEMRPSAQVEILQRPDGRRGELKIGELSERRHGGGAC